MSIAACVAHASLTCCCCLRRPNAAAAAAAAAATFVRKQQRYCRIRVRSSERTAGYVNTLGIWQPGYGNMGIVQTSAMQIQPALGSTQLGP